MNERWEFDTDTNGDEELVPTNDKQAYKTRTFGKDAILFVIDAYSSVQESQPNQEKSPLLMALRSVCSIILGQLRRGSTHPMGILFFNTRTSNFTDLNNIYLWHGLELLEIEKIKQLEQLIHTPSTIHSHVQPHDMSDAVLGDIFTACCSVFNSCNNILPNNLSEQKINYIEEALMKLCNLDVHVQLFPISPLDPWLNPTTLYKVDTLKSFNKYSYEHNDMQTMVEPSNNDDDLLTRLERHVTRRRVYTRLPFALTDHTIIGIKIYNVIHKRRKEMPKYIYRNHDSTYKVQSRPQYIIQDTNEPVDNDKLQYYYWLGGEKIVFTKDEWKQMTDFGEPSIRLLGFKPQDSLKLYHTILPPYFAYPDEEAYSGSITTFTALLKTLYTKKQVAIARMIIWPNTEPYLVAMLPQLEITDLMPPGFHIITLPFLDAIREHHVPQSVKASEEQIDLIKGIISKWHLRKAFNLHILQDHYNQLQAVLLKQDEPELISDTAIPKFDIIHKRIGVLAKEFKRQLNMDDYLAMEKEKEEVASARKNAIDRSHIIQLAHNKQLDRVSQYTIQISNSTITDDIQQQQPTTTTKRSCNIGYAKVEYKLVV
ncbi:SPOC like C-terminal domain-containing protein [Syncephalis plumigaleata]|nr:SPOC like C-terminal domain-containing protein [Syncephalis plumigaleata]